MMISVDALDVGVGWLMMVALVELVDDGDLMNWN